MTRYVQLSIALLSAALLAFQIILLQAFSSVQWYHFAYMVISVALLGFGASGTVLSIAQQWFRTHHEDALTGAVLLSAASMPISLALTQLPPARFDSYLLLTDPGQIGSLILTYVLLTIPFFAGALAIGLSFVIHTERMGRLYFANLVGSGAGGLLGLALLYVDSPPPLAAATGLVAALAAGCLLLRRARPVTVTLWLVVSALNIVLMVVPPGLRPSEYKDLQRALLIPDVEITSSTPHPMGTVQAARSALFRDAPGLSLTYRGEVPSHDLLFVNGDISRSMGGDAHVRLRDYTTAALPYVLDRPGSVLVLGGIRPAAIGQALAHGAQDVTVSEPHGGIRRAFVSRGHNTLVQDPRVQVYSGNSRTLLAQRPRVYDLVVMPDVGSFGGASGLTALQEQYDLTLESLGRMWQRLSPDGAIAATVWIDYPARSPLRLLAMMIETLETNGIMSPQEHLLAVRSWSSITIVARRRPVRSLDGSVRTWADSLLFDPLVLPDIQPSERERHNVLQDSALLQAVDSLLTGDRSDFYRSYPFRIAPPVDDRPYFSQFLKWSRLGELWTHFGRSRIPFFELGTLIVALTLVQVAVLAVVLIVLPVVRIGGKKSGRWSTGLYFAGLAVGFMFVELTMIQRFTMYLGHPVVAVAFVFSVLLVSSGLGSLTSSRVAAGAANVRIAAGRVVAGLVVLLLVLGPVMNATIGLGFAWRLLVGIALLGPVAFLMGFPFPVGLRALSTHRPLLVPWAWGVNGCVSVTSAPAAILLAADAGAALVIVVAVVTYAVAVLAVRGLVTASD